MVYKLVNLSVLLDNSLSPSRSSGHLRGREVLKAEDIYRSVKSVCMLNMCEEREGFGFILWKYEEMKLAKNQKWRATFSLV
jgi:hypothetical protein